SQFADIQRRDALHQLLRTIAGRAAQPAKNERPASDAGLPTTTLERYLSLFEEVFLIKRVPPLSASTTERAVRMRKLLFEDSGLRHLQARVPERFHHGVVLYSGSKTLPFGARLLAAPIEAMWHTH